MAEKEIGTGIIGAGFMGATYARTVETQVNGATLKAAAGGSRAPDLAKEYGVTHYDDWRDLIADDDLGMVLIATPHAAHGEEALAAAEAGKHLLIDKPMADSVETCDAILAACREKNLKCAITWTQRNRIGFTKSKELIDSGRLGKVQHIRTTHVVAEGIGNVPAWQRDPANIGTLFGHGVHNFDLIRKLTGREIVSVFAKCRTLSGAPVEATSDVLVTMDDGTVHYVLCSFELCKPGFPRTEYGARIACENGLIDLDTYNETRVSTEGGKWEVLAVQPEIDWAGNGFLDPVRLETYAGILQDLVDAIAEDREPEASGWDGRQAVAAAMAAYESSRTGKEIEL
jgi:phthalate 4,5-cis-dihydrodiol dehydrogenase